jgi:hypothetical protein
VQLNWLDGTAPLFVGDENVQVALTVVVPCWTVIVALVNATSVIDSVQLEPGHPGAPGIGDTGASVVTEKAALPFLIALDGMLCSPVSVTGAGF